MSSHNVLARRTTSNTRSGSRSPSETKKLRGILTNNYTRNSKQNLQQDGSQYKASPAFQDGQRYQEDDMSAMSTNVNNLNMPMP